MSRQEPPDDTEMMHNAKSDNAATVPVDPYARIFTSESSPRERPSRNHRGATKVWDTNRYEFEVGDVVRFVLPDGETIRPALIVRLGRTNKAGQQIDYDADVASLHVFYDGQNDRVARGPAPDATTTDWKRNVTRSIPIIEDDSSIEYMPSTWH